MDNKTIVEEWIADERETFDQWIAEATRVFREDATVRLPRTEDERHNGMEMWLDQRRAKLREELGKSFPHFFPSLAQRLSPTYISGLFDELVWPQVKPEIERYAIFGFAASWAGRNMGDATSLGTPRYDTVHWRVPIGVRNYGDNLGQIVLNLEGDVIQGLTTSRRELLEAIHESSLQPVSTAAG